MICQSSYDSFEAIPEAMRGDFENKNGKWVMKLDAIPGAAELLNPGLAANRDRALTQYTNEQTRAAGLETQLAQATAELNNIKSPGSRILGGDDAKAYDGYVALGSLKDVKKIVDDHPKLVAQVEGAAKETTIQKVAAETGVNPEVLKDWANMESAKNLEFYAKEVEIDDPAGGKDKVKVKQLYAKKSSVVDGKTEITDHSFDELTSNIPSYMKEALTKVETAEGETTNGQSAIVANKGVQIPNLGSTRTTPVKTDDKKPVDTFNKARESKVNPLLPSAPAAGKTE